jgi:predicted acetyltransferase
MEVIFLIRHVMEQYREQKDSHVASIDLEKVYDKIAKNVMLTLDKHKLCFNEVCRSH